MKLHKQGGRRPSGRKPWKWYVHGNHAASSLIAARFEEEIKSYTVKVCSDGVARDLWELDVEFVDSLANCTPESANLGIEVYADRGDGRVVRIHDPCKEIQQYMALAS